ncbi:hypothetical protein [Halarsenatibacter silvermanii]|uniref:hypothetical protein n=1 Tax=Halarsenatibacter silvermanii TaxID=321763 RepID=UPI000B7D93EA|nr:hypothetical protein [Halarsenatibacter silvermanii]
MTLVVSWRKLEIENYRMINLIELNSGYFSAYLSGLKCSILRGIRGDSLSGKRMKIIESSGKPHEIGRMHGIILRREMRGFVRYFHNLLTPQSG